MADPEECKEGGEEEEVGAKGSWTFSCLKGRGVRCLERSRVSPKVYYGEYQATQFDFVLASNHFSQEREVDCYYLHISNNESCAHLFILSRLMVEPTISKQKAVDTVAKINSSLLPVS